MLQLGGGLLLFLSALLLGQAAARAEEQRVRQAEGLLLLLRHIRMGITCYATPIGEIYAGFQNPALEVCGFLPALRAGGLEHALAACGRQLHIEGEDRRTLHTFSQSIGKSYTAEQAALCDAAIKELEEMWQRRRAEGPRRVRAAQALSLCAGLMLLLLLW